MFGSLISAVDTVATLSILGNPELKCDPLLYSLVFGESVLNDAVAIVLFKTFQGFFDSGEAFSSATIPAILLNFSAVSLGSVFVGVVIGLICSYLCKHTEMYKYPEYEISMLFLFAYGSYSFSEALELSGIMSLFFCGLVMSHYNSYNLSATSQVTAHYIFKSLAVLSEFFVFLYIGMGIFTGKFKHWNFIFFILCILFCLIGRFFNTFPLSILSNIWRSRVISRKMQCVIWFAGLRGAISFALVSTSCIISPNFTSPDFTSPNRTSPSPLFLCYAVLCHAMLCYAMLCCSVLSSPVLSCTLVSDLELFSIHLCSH